MERVGISRHIDGEEFDMYGERTYFRSVCGAAVAGAVAGGRWFCFCKGADKKQEDIMAVENGSGVKLGSFAAECFSEITYRDAIYKYLLHEFLCYYESPIVKKDTNLNGYKNSYNKYLITSNIRVVAEWLGISVEEAERQYGSRLVGVENNDDSPFYPYLKLYETKSHERKVTKPRSMLDLSDRGIRIVPLFALKVGVDELYSLLLQGTYDVTFLKDSGQVRSINTTFNREIAVNLYNDTGFVDGGFRDVYNGDFSSNPALERGYIRVFELGSSIYNNPTRSINFARIVEFKKADPDMSYMYIDIESVLDTFILSINSRRWADEEIDEFVDMLDVFEVGVDRTLNKVRISSVMQIENWANAQEMLLSTVFLRQLALFMIGNPQWFDGYDGTPKLKKVERSGCSPAQGTEYGMDLDDIGLPFSM